MAAGLRARLHCGCLWSGHKNFVGAQGFPRVIPNSGILQAPSLSSEKPCAQREKPLLCTPEEIPISTSPSLKFISPEIKSFSSTIPTAKPARSYSILRIETRHFSGLSADQGTACLKTAIRNTFDDVRDSFPDNFPAGNVIKENNGLAAGAGNN